MQNTLLNYFLLSLVPTLFWLWIFSRQDKFEKEPKRMLATAVILGALSTFLAFVFEEIFLNRLGVVPYTLSLLERSFLAMIVVGVVEETVKLFTLWVSVYRSKYFNEVSDGIIYGVAIGLGFAFVENILYSLRFGINVSLLRAFGTPIFHAAASAISAYYFTRARFNPEFKSSKYFGLVLAIIAHALSNYLIIIITELNNVFYFPLYVAINLFLIILIFVLYRRSLKETTKDCEPPTVNPITAAVLNIAPGAGFFYLGRFSLGFFFILEASLFAVAFLLSGLYFPFSILPLIFAFIFAALWVAGIFIAYFQGKKHLNSKSQISNAK